MNEEELLRREEAILDEIIRYYMSRHEAISARTLSKISRLSLSPTTIRNLMEDLSAEGFLTTQGVTRGRIPTQKAFAIYVRKLGSQRPPHRIRAPEIQPLEEGRPPRLDAALEAMGGFLAEETGLVALAELPGRDRYPLDWVRFFAMPDNQVLVVLQTLFGDLWSKLLVAAERFPEDLLEEVGRFIRQTYRGASLEAVRDDIMAGEPKEILGAMPSLGAGFRMLRKAFEWNDVPGWRFWGESNLFHVPEWSDAEQLLRLHRILRDPALLERALGQGRQIEGGTVSIGTELSCPGLEDGALVAFPFGWGPWQGRMAVLGPMRMEYAQVFNLTAQVSRELSTFLQHCVRASGAGSRAPAGG